MAGLLLHGVLLTAYGAAPGRAAAQVGTLAFQVVAATVVWVCRDRLPDWFWPCNIVVATLLVGTMPSTYPQAVLGVLSLLFADVMFATRLLGRNVARLATAEAVVVTFWVLHQVDLTNRQIAVDLFFTGGALVLVHLLLLSATDEQFRLMGQLERMARVDGLTGCLTRTAFDERLEGALQQSSVMSLLIVDVDMFKTVNDTYGHPVGDAVLRHVTALLTAAIRHDDAVVGRLGGDELAVLLRGCPEDVVWRRAQELASSIGQQPLVLADDTAVPVTVSIGVAHIAGRSLAEATSTAPLYSRADAALYQAKKNGRGHAELAAPLC